MKTLVVYYSLQGNTKKVGEKIAEGLGADTLELITKKKYPSSKFLMMISGVKDIIFKVKPELINQSIDLNGYDTIVLGTPIWAGTYTPPLSTFLSENKLLGKRLVLFATHQGGGADMCFKKLREELSDNSFLGQMDFNSKEANDLKLKNWIEEIITKIQS